MLRYSNLGWWMPGPLYILLFWFQTETIRPLETWLLGPQAAVASLLFLPAGLKIVSYYLFRWKCLPSLILGTFVAHHLMYQPGEANWAPALVGSAASALALPFVHHAARLMRLDIFRDYQIRPVHWRHLLSIAFLAAAVSGTGFVFSWSLIDPSFAGLGLLPRFMLGDTTGAFVFLSLVMFAYRIKRGQPVA